MTTQTQTTPDRTDMIDWLAELSFGDVDDSSYFDELTNAELARGIDRHYCGGVEQFIDDCAPCFVGEC